MSHSSHLSSSFPSSPFFYSLPPPSQCLIALPVPLRSQTTRSPSSAGRCQGKDQSSEGRLGQRQEISGPEGTRRNSQPTVGQQAQPGKGDRRLEGSPRGNSEKGISCALHPLARILTAVCNRSRTSMLPKPGPSSSLLKRLTLVSGILRVFVLSTDD